jgi:hypothetical protein
LLFPHPITINTQKHRARIRARVYSCRKTHPKKHVGFSPCNSVFGQSRRIEPESRYSPTMGGAWISENIPPKTCLSSPIVIAPLWPGEHCSSPTVASSANSSTSQ